MKQIYRLKLGIPILITSLTLIITLLIFIRVIWNPYEITRVRNSLIAKVGEDREFLWKPGYPPQDFLLEGHTAPTKFKEVVSALAFSQQEGLSNLDKAIAIGQHLAQGKRAAGGAIMSNTLDAYDLIIKKNKGYCADYTQVFNGLAIAAGIPVREWGMSFDGYSGWGHAFSEVYDNKNNKWVFFDTYKSFYVRDRDSNVPLSALEFRERLRTGVTNDELRVEPIDNNALAFKNSVAALEYYRRGSDQFYLWYGNNVFSYDNHPVVRLFGAISRAVEQSAAILLGIHPGIRLLRTETNQDLIENLFQVRAVFMWGTILVFALVFNLLLELGAYRRKSSIP